jgi:hypothetical protein
MTDADQRRVRQALEHQPHELVLALRIERGGGLVHDDDVRPVEEDAGEA